MSDLCFLYDKDRGRWQPLAGEGSGTPWLLTYPIDLGAKRIRSIEFGGCAMAGELTVAVYVSDTKGGWRLERLGSTSRGRIGAICGSGGRYRRFLVIGNAPEELIVRT